MTVPLKSLKREFLRCGGPFTVGDTCASYAVVIKKSKAVSTPKDVERSVLDSYIINTH